MANILGKNNSRQLPRAVPWLRSHISENTYNKMAT